MGKGKKVLMMFFTFLYLISCVYALSLELEREGDILCGGIMSKEYELGIFNDGEIKIDVQMALSAPEWVRIDKTSFSLNSNDKENIRIIADVPANANGIFNVVVSGAIKNMPIKSEKLRLEVVPKYDCYKADIIVDAKIASDYSESYIPIKLRNSGLKQANYEISLDAPNWVGIEPKMISINPEQFGNLNLHINPDSSVREGNYPVSINVKFEDIVYSKDVNIMLKKENKFLKNIRYFFVFYQYYIYLVLFIAIILFIFRKQIISKVKTTYKKHKTKRARLKALEKAREARRKK